MKMVWKVTKWLVIAVVVVLVLLQFKRPTRSNPPVDESQTIHARTEVTPQVNAIFDRSCRDCHSNKTVWPWYTNAAPISWFIVDHVNEGREHLNLSEWGKLDKDRQDKRLREICDEVTDGNMPLSSYTPLHPGSTLSAEDIKTLCEWTNAERERLGK
jgi:Haem-binding domain